VEGKHIQFLIEQKIEVFRTVCDISMLWWVSSVVFCASILAALWIKRCELEHLPYLGRLSLSALLSVFFISIIFYGVWVYWYFSVLQGDLAKLLHQIKASPTTFDTELNLAKLAILTGASSFGIVLIIWVILICAIWRSLRGRGSNEISGSSCNAELNSACCSVKERRIETVKNMPLDLKQYHNPPFGYFSSVYMTLHSVFQSFAFAGIMTAAATRFTFDLGGEIDWRWPEYVVSGLVVLMLWHKYVSHHQFIGWQLTIWDTIIVAGFGLIEGLMVATLNHRDAEGVVHLLIALLFFGGVVAYWHAGRQTAKPYVKHIFDEHYKEHAEAMYHAIVGFENVSQSATLKIGITLVGIAVLCLWKPELSRYLSAASVVLLCVFLWKWDLNRWLQGDRWKSL